jgi:tetratricopeptide (TPR) repeat protein
MYALDSNNIIIANNLASLVGTYHDDPESLDTAWTIARRFRDTELPAIQDTYGWLTHRRGDSADALPYLQAAAAGLEDDPIVQYHLGEILFALERPEDALIQFRATLEKAGLGDTRPMIEIARTRIAEIEASLAVQVPETE